MNVVMNIIAIMSFGTSIFALYLYMKPNIICTLSSVPTYHGDLNGPTRKVSLIITNNGYFRWKGYVLTKYVRKENDSFRANGITDHYMEDETSNFVRLARYEKINISLGYISLDSNQLIAQCFAPEVSFDELGDIEVSLIHTFFEKRKKLHPNMELIDTIRDFDKDQSNKYQNNIG